MTRRYHTVVETVLLQIAEGSLQAGERLPRETDFAQRHGVSRGVARETIQALRERGVIDVRHGTGQWVLSEDSWNLLDADVLRAIVSAARVDLLEEILECRRLLGPGAAALAADRATRTGLDALDAAFAAVKLAAGRRERPNATDDPLAQAEVEFHTTLIELTGNRPLQRMLEPVHGALAAARHELVEGRRVALVRQLGRIHHAVVDADADAAAAALEANVRQLGVWLRAPVHTAV